MCINCFALSFLSQHTVNKEFKIDIFILKYIHWTIPNDSWQLVLFIFYQKLNKICEIFNKS